jgi:NAD(P)-dependent dehydrogenase (short-subunit alcohol dehydrogenase family)
MGTVIITGANGSLAIPAVDYLLSQHPSYTAVLTVRDDSDKDANTTRLRSIIAKYSNAQVSIRKLDLTRLSHVHAFADTIHSEIAEKKLQPLAAIICNASTWDMSPPIKYTDDGFERAMGVNHIAQFDLTLRLLGDLDPQHGRVVFLSSESHWAGKAGFEVYHPTLPDDLNLLVKPNPDKVGEEVGRGFQRYGLSKLVIVMTMYELLRRVKKVSRIYKS